MAHIVYEGVKNTTGNAGGLFDGQSFWFSSAVPLRKWLIEKAEANGATIVPLEKQADVLIVDHARKNAPVGSHSYKYIEQSIRTGRLERLADHAVGPSKSTNRPVGSITTASKINRSKFTEEEDQLLWNFVKPYESAGGAIGGNEIYKQLENAHGNGRHTFQSWRDRYLKHVKFQTREITETVYAAEDADTDAVSEELEQTAEPLIKREESEPLPSLTSMRQGSVTATSFKSSPRRIVAATNLRAPVVEQSQSRPAPRISDDAATIRYREALQRKLGRVLPNVPSPPKFRDWQKLPDLQSPPDALRTEATRVQHVRAGLGAYAPVEHGVRGRSPKQREQASAEKETFVTDSQDMSQEFSEDEYMLLFKAADHIIRVGDGDDDEWQAMAAEYPAHSARAWRAFWDEKVKPDYQKQTKQIKTEHAKLGNLAGAGVIGTDQATSQDTMGGSAGQANGVSSRDSEWIPSLPSDEESDEEDISFQKGDDEEVFEEEDRTKEVVEDAGKLADEEYLVDEGIDENVFPGQDGDTLKSRVDEGEIIEDMENYGHGLDSLFDSPLPGTPEETFPFACKWLGCKARPLNMNMLVQHVSNTHRPRKGVTEDSGYICNWNGCIKASMDRFGNKVTLILSSREEWANHLVEEHIKPIQRKHGLGPSPTRRRLSLGAAAMAKSGKDTETEDLEEVQETVQENINEQLDEQLQEQVPEQVDQHETGRKEERDSRDVESEEAEETEAVSTSTDSTNETISTNSDDMDEEYIDLETPRRSNRLTSVPRPAVVPDSAFSYIDKAVGSSPPPAAQNMPPRTAKSPSPSPLEVTPTKRPSSNEARKRSATKENSQESVQSTSNTQEVPDLESQEQPGLAPSKKGKKAGSALEREHQRIPELPLKARFEPQAKRRKQYHQRDETPLEIPSTPEHRTVLGELQRESHNDVHLRRKRDPNEHSFAPPGPHTPGRQTTVYSPGDGGTQHTSPLQISMFSDPNNDNQIEMLSSPAKSTASARHDDLSSEPDLEFETAPQTNTHQLWATAPSEQPEEEGSDAEVEVAFDTAPDTIKDNGKGKMKVRLDTQALFAQSVPDEGDLFALPEPEGGWPDNMDDDDNVLGGPLQELPVPVAVLLPTSPSYQLPQLDETGDENDPAEAAEADDSDAESAISLPADLPTWVTEMTTADPSLDVETLLLAMNATSGVNERLIVSVHDYIRSMRRDRRRGKVRGKAKEEGTLDEDEEEEMLPQLMRGCWTHEDDEVIRGGEASDARERMRVVKKHGRRGVERRRAWLGVDGEDE